MRTRFATWSLIALALSAASPAFAASTEYSLIVAPARYSVMQVLFDVISQRSAVLVSYQGEATTENPALHVWNGSVWTPMSLHEFQELGFVQSTPARAILIGDESLLPTVVRDGISWLPEVVFIRDLGTASLLNELGRVFTWSSREWRWFAKRYNLGIEDQAAAERARSWYDQPGPIKKDAAPVEPVYSPVAPAPVETVPYVPPALSPSPSEPLPVLEPAPVSETQPDEAAMILKKLEEQRAIAAPAAPAEAPPAADSFPIK